MNFYFLAAAGGQGNPMSSILSILPMILFIFFFYYLFVASPMKKKQKAFEELMKGLKSGDRILTNSGIYGTVTGISDKTVKLRIANNVVVDLDKSAITGLAPEEGKEDKK
jgi:preprotein translocase subunit YajC